MRRLLTPLVVLSVGLLLAFACTEDNPGNLFPEMDAGVGGQSSVGGSAGMGGGGTGGLGGSSGMASGGAGGDGGSMTAGSGGRAPDAGPGDCSVDGDCDDNNACTADSCQAGRCVTGVFAALGTACGSTTNDPCTAPDTCDGAGLCQPNNNAAAVGMPCGSGTDDVCANPDTCDAQGICQGNDEVAGTPCGSPTDDECTHPDVCDDFGQCSQNNAAAGTPCGSQTDDDCANPDVCGNGVCLANDAANGTTCGNSSGSCTAGACVDGQPVGCPVDVVNPVDMVSGVPITLNWSSVGRPDLFGGGCDIDFTPDYALVFTAPQTGTYRFDAVALVDATPYTGSGDASGTPEGPPDGDAVITVAEGSCGGQQATPVDCNDDLVPGMLDSRLELPLTAGDVITVYLNELTQSGGGTGTLNITLLP